MTLSVNPTALDRQCPRQDMALARRSVDADRYWRAPRQCRDHQGVPAGDAAGHEHPDAAFGLGGDHAGFIGVPPAVDQLDLLGMGDELDVVMVVHRRGELTLEL